MVDKKIKNLVGLLNKVSYIRTISSCEGHFEDGVSAIYGISKTSVTVSKKQRYSSRHSPAYVMFELKGARHKTVIEWELENMINKICLESYDPKGACVQITKRYPFSRSKNYCNPEDWRIDFPISGLYLPAYKKRKATDLSIKMAENAVKEYLKSYKRHPIMYLQSKSKGIFDHIESIKQKL